MPLSPIDEAHALQIQAGTLGRKAGHGFEASLTNEINSLGYPCAIEPVSAGHVFTGDPAILLLHYIATRLGLRTITTATAISTGALATSEEGQKWLSINGANVTRCKSDLVLTLAEYNQRTTVGISTKQCNAKRPTNAQVYFTTARAFVNLLRLNGIAVTDIALKALRQFCGEPGFRPSDNPAIQAGRQTDPRHFFWEEIDAQGRAELELVLSDYQAAVSRLVFQKAYIEDDMVPEYLLHKTKRCTAWGTTEIAIYSIAELIDLSLKYQRFATKPYRVSKGSHKDPKGVTHLAPRFGIIQMQRAGQQQHPEQLQFNLKAGYFYKI